MFKFAQKHLCFNYILFWTICNNNLFAFGCYHWTEVYLIFQNYGQLCDLHCLAKYFVCPFCFCFLWVDCGLCHPKASRPFNDWGLQLRISFQLFHKMWAYTSFLFVDEDRVMPLVNTGCWAVKWCRHSGCLYHSTRGYLYLFGTHNFRCQSSGPWTYTSFGHAVKCNNFCFVLFVFFC